MENLVPRKIPHENSCLKSRAIWEHKLQILRLICTHSSSIHWRTWHDLYLPAGAGFESLHDSYLWSHSLRHWDRALYCTDHNLQLNLKQPTLSGFRYDLICRHLIMLRWTPSGSFWGAERRLNVLLQPPSYWTIFRCGNFRHKPADSNLQAKEDIRSSPVLRKELLQQSEHHLGLRSPL